MILLKHFRLTRDVKKRKREPTKPVQKKPAIPIKKTAKKKPVKNHQPKQATTKEPKNHRPNNDELHSKKIVENFSMLLIATQSEEFRSDCLTLIGASNCDTAKQGLAKMLKQNFKAKEKKTKAKLEKKKKNQ